MTSSSAPRSSNALVVPVHVGGLSAFRTMVEAFNTTYATSSAATPTDEAFDLVLLTSGPDDAHLFTGVLKRGWHVPEISTRIIDLSEITHRTGEPIGRDAVLAAMSPLRRGPCGSAIINVKKFLGIIVLAEEYDDLIVVDDDAYPLRRLDQLFPQTKANARLGLIPVANAPVVLDHPCAAAISEGTERVTRQPLVIDHRRAQTSWFFNPPHYAAEQVRLFETDVISRHGSLSGFLAALEWGSFDQLVWHEWQIDAGLARPFDLAQILGPTSPPEFLTVDQRERIEQATGLRSLWAWLGRNPRPSESDVGLLLALHADRATSD